LVSLFLFAINCIAMEHYFGVEWQRTSKFEDQFGCGRSVGKEEGLFTFTASHALECISVSLGENVVWIVCGLERISGKFSVDCVWS
jgi:hypothetical protein